MWRDGSALNHHHHKATHPRPPPLPRSRYKSSSSGVNTDLVGPRMEWESNCKQHWHVGCVGPSFEASASATGPFSRLQSTGPGRHRLGEHNGAAPQQGSDQSHLRCPAPFVVDCYQYWLRDRKKLLKTSKTPEGRSATFRVQGLGYVFFFLCFVYFFVVFLVLFFSSIAARFLLTFLKKTKKHFFESSSGWTPWKASFFSNL